MKLDGIRQKVFIDRYSLKDEKGNPTEKTPDEMWRRVARGIAGVEKKSVRKKWENKFVELMNDFKFVPGGRILSGAGTNYQVTYFNCFVIPSPKDSREGIIESLKQLVEIQSRSGGVGLNLSSLRPRGSRVKKVNGTSSGPVTWAGLFSYATHDVVQQGGTRRGATMIMLWDWHPDVEEFITVKQDLSKINGANLSVCVSDAFMEAVKKDADWDLVYPDLDEQKYDESWNGEIDEWKKLGGKIKVYKTVKARYLWDLICTAAWRSAEPGLHFLERSNKRSNTFYFERLIATNPCLTGDTWIHTSHGPRQVKQLLGQPFVARVNGQDYPSAAQGFFKTVTKEVIRLETKEGYTLQLTADHKVSKVTKLTRYTLNTEWIETGKLTVGDKVVLHDHSDRAEWSGSYTSEDGYLMGLLVGDGTLKKDKAVLSVWDVNKNQASPSVQSVMQLALQATATVSYRSDFIGWTHIADRNEYRLSLAYITQLAKNLGMAPSAKAITPIMEQASSNFYKGFLRGFFDADGCIQGTQVKGISVRLAQSNLITLQAVQRMLLRLSIVSSIYKNRREEKKAYLPNGKGAYAYYSTKAQHELIISGENIHRFAELIGFGDAVKQTRLKQLLVSYKRVGNRERFVAEVAALVPAGIEDVYDAQIPEVHAFDANGLYVHNCGEQPLGAWAVCNLGAMNLAAYVKPASLASLRSGSAGGNAKFDFKNFGKDVQTAIRFMDNVIDQTYYFFPENEKCAKDIRRTGLGIMGIADALIKMKLRYGSEESLPVIQKIFETLRNNAYESSSDIAKEKGSFPKFEKSKYLKGYHIKALPKRLQDTIKKQGIRNAVLLTIAPTGTTSLVAGVSSGIEPVYEFTFKRRWRGGEDMFYHPLLQEWMDKHPGQERPDYFVSANDLTPLDHTRVQAVAQEYIDSSISKTVNAPKSHTVEDVKTLYMAAYDMGLKGITYMRDGSRQGVLERVDEKKKEEVKEVLSQEAVEQPVVHRPMQLEGVTYQLQTPVGKTYVTINNDQRKEPFEIFITIGKSGSDVAAMADALGRMISLNLRLNGALKSRERMKQVIAHLAGIGGARSVGFGKDKVRSLPDAVAKILAKHYGFIVNGKVEDALTTSHAKVDEAAGAVSNGGNGQTEKGEQKEEQPVVAMQQLSIDGGASGVSTDMSATSLFDLCPECGSGTLAYEEGCKKCYSCGYSEC